MPAGKTSTKTGQASKAAGPSPAAKSAKTAKTATKAPAPAPSSKAAPKTAAKAAPPSAGAPPAGKTAPKAAPKAPPPAVNNRALAQQERRALGGGAPKTASKTEARPAAAPSAPARPPQPPAPPATSTPNPPAPNVARTTPPAGMPAGVPAGPARPTTGVRPSTGTQTTASPASTAPAGSVGVAGLRGAAAPSQAARPALAPARPGLTSARPGVAPARTGIVPSRPPAPSTIPSVRLGTRVGSGKWSYEPVPDWGRGAGPGSVTEFGTVSGIACDSKDNVYVFQRTIEPCVLVFSPDGRLLRKFGADTFRNPHGIWIGPDATRRGEEVALLTDRDLHQVVKYTLEGRKLATWGAAYREPGDAGQPFNQPARATLGPRGEMYVADGYGQYRVHQFSPEGELVHSWGKRGKGPGEFGWPVHHALLDPRGRLIVADRGNNRLQIFSPRGKYQAEWTDLDMPQDYVITRENEIMLCEGNAKRIAVLDLDGAVLARWGESGNRPGQFAASPHSIWVDSRGDIYVGEVIDPNRLTKFVRR